VPKFWDYLNSISAEVRKVFDIISWCCLYCSLHELNSFFTHGKVPAQDMTPVATSRTRSIFWVLTSFSESFWSVLYDLVWCVLSYVTLSKWSYVYLCSYVIFCTELSVSFLGLHSCYGAVSCSLIAESDWRRNGFPGGREIPKRVLCRVAPPVVVRICKNRAWTTFFLCRAENQPWRCMLYLDFRWGALMRCHPD
jgi:hypothetical protein